MAACGSAQGASQAVFRLAAQEGWKLLSSAYGIREADHNVPALGDAAIAEWKRIESKLIRIRDELVFDWPVVSVPAKDRPILFSAAASADVLLTLDKKDFGSLMVHGFYGLPILKPGHFLERERHAGRLQEKTI